MSSVDEAWENYAYETRGLPQDDHNAFEAGYKAAENRDALKGITDALDELAREDATK